MVLKGLKSFQEINVFVSSFKFKKSFNIGELIIFIMIFFFFFDRKMKLCCFARSKRVKGYHVCDGTYLENKYKPLSVSTMAQELFLYYYYLNFMAMG